MKRGWTFARLPLDVVVTQPDDHGISRSLGLLPASVGRRCRRGMRASERVGETYLLAPPQKKWIGIAARTLPSRSLAPQGFQVTPIIRIVKDNRDIIQLGSTFLFTDEAISITLSYPRGIWEKFRIDWCH